MAAKGGTERPRVEGGVAVVGGLPSDRWPRSAPATRVSGSCLGREWVSQAGGAALPNLVRRVLLQLRIVNDCLRSALELSPAYTSMLPASTTNAPRLS